MTDMPHEVDVHVGRRVRQRRKVLGITQEKLGEALGLTFQQVQKYERGANRISASKLFELSQLLKVPVGYFYEDMTREQQLAVAAMSEAAPDPFEGENLSARESRELLQAYYRLPSDKVRKQMLALMRSLAEDEGKG